MTLVCTIVIPIYEKAVRVVSISPFSKDSPPFSVIHVFLPVPRGTELSV